MTRIRADFTSIDSEGRVRSHVSRADGPVRRGDRLTVYDAEGNECEAKVGLLDQVAGTLALELETSTWRDAAVVAPLTSGRNRARRP
jgi:hypothetical protein